MVRPLNQKGCAMSVAKNTPLYRNLYVQVLGAIALGILLGAVAPEYAVKMKILGDGFIKLIKMLIGPIIFCTVVSGIASMGSMKEAGSIGLKAILFFFVFSVLSLVIGMVVANVAKPGVGMNVDASKLDISAVEAYTGGTVKLDSPQDFILHIIPKTPVDAFASGEILQVLFFALLFAGAATALGAKGKPIIKFVDDISHFFFAMIGFIMKLAPIGAFGAMAYTVGEYGAESLLPLLKLLLCFYATCLFFVFVVQWAILRWCGFGIWQYLRYIKDELVIVLGTCSSETVFPRMIDKLTALGCDRSVVGMVLPTGYSFNLVGSSIAMSLSAIFLAQATNTPLSTGQEIMILGIMLLTSKGAAGVVGSAFVVLTATLASLDIIPVASVAIILGIDRFMSEGRAITNLISNGIATIFMAKWEGKLDSKRAHAVLSGKIKPELESTAAKAIV
jgi:aerobic C4-dicarboxylate transport protein